MFQLGEKFVKFLVALCALTGFFGFSVVGQIYENSVDEVEVLTLHRFGAQDIWCVTQNHVVDEAMYKRLASNPNLKKECAEMYQSLDVDFTKQTLISYHAGGDCALRVTSKVFRNDQTKIYTVRIRNRWGGCRAGGWSHGWLLIEKVPPDYKVEFAETQVQGLRETAINEDVIDLYPQSAKKTEARPEIIETRLLNMKNCIQTIFTKRFVINDEETYLKTIRNDASRDRCLQTLEKIDFGKHTLVGVEINSGYCGMPLGLRYETFKDKTKKQYLLSVSYIAPEYGGCRALMPYDLWVLVPKIPDNYEVGFEVTANTSK